MMMPDSAPCQVNCALDIIVTVRHTHGRNSHGHSDETV